MKLSRHKHSGSRAATARRGSVLIMVIWVIFGLIAITIYFANAMTSEIRAADNRAAGMEADQAIEGARRYISCVLSNLNSPGEVPDPRAYQCEAVPVGQAKFWLIGRTNVETLVATSPAFGLIDEAAKINLNTSMAGTNLFLIPRLTLQDTYNIMAWRSTNTTSTLGGAESDTYQGLPTPYMAKNAPFETVDELHMVSGMDIDTLYGEDPNQNGFLDPNENDGDILPPTDNLDGHLDPGLIEYVTVYTHEPTTQTNGTARFNVTTTAGINSIRTNLAALFGSGADAVVPAGSTNTSVLDFWVKCSGRGMSQAEFTQLEANLMGTNLQGLININTASAAVLQCLPGMDTNQAAQVVQYRQANQSNPNNMNTLSWITQVGLAATTITSIGPWVTGKSYQFTADVAAVGHNGRGYRRTRFVFDISSGTPIIVHRQDLTNLGWALGKQARDKLLATQ